jgi:DNA-binding XRE family transcriptional regulator
MNKRGVVDFNQWLNKRLKNPDFRKAYEQVDEDPFINVALQIIRLREEKHLTQSQLAKKVKTSQQAIARMESLRYRGYTLDSVHRIAKAFHKKVSIRFV